MNSKLVSFLVLLTIVQSFGHEGWEPWNEEVARGTTVGLACDHPFCVAPCPGTAPPRYCPANMTKCISGCACMLECQSPTYVCFPTKYCISRRRYLSKRPTTAIV
ncbi:uncharacterized protein LOC125067430 [Vanessa atalanta]|uniref:uncharacterized protein LOC125067430 n=1 Tax=Vanessa atalanta TaxID=42275 RepID=UPI001FCE1186|nr:uncharacterized protein LOC125067430 [Vanessa atalanta]